MTTVVQSSNKQKKKRKNWLTERNIELEEWNVWPLHRSQNPPLSYTFRLFQSETLSVSVGPVERKTNEKEGKGIVPRQNIRWTTSFSKMTTATVRVTNRPTEKQDMDCDVLHKICSMHVMLWYGVITFSFSLHTIIWFYFPFVCFPSTIQVTHFISCSPMLFFCWFDSHLFRSVKSMKTYFTCLSSHSITHRRVVMSLFLFSSVNALVNKRKV